MLVVVTVTTVFEDHEMLFPQNELSQFIEGLIEAHMDRLHLHSLKAGRVWISGYWSDGSICLIHWRHLELLTAGCSFRSLYGVLRRSLSSAGR